MIDQKKISKPVIADCHVLNSDLLTLNDKSGKINSQAKVVAVITIFSYNIKFTFYIFLEFIYMSNPDIPLLLDPEIFQ